MQAENKVGNYETLSGEYASAVRFDGHNVAEVMQLTGGRVSYVWYVEPGSKPPYSKIRVVTAAGNTVDVSLGDWVVKLDGKVKVWQDYDFRTAHPRWERGVAPPIGDKRAEAGRPEIDGLTTTLPPGCNIAEESLRRFLAEGATKWSCNDHDSETGEPRLIHFWRDAHDLGYWERNNGVSRNIAVHYLGKHGHLRDAEAMARLTFRDILEPCCVVKPSPRPDDYAAGKYSRKSLAVWAVRYSGKNVDEFRKLVGHVNAVQEFNDKARGPYITAFIGGVDSSRVHVGDWLVLRRGAPLRYTDEEFRETYDVPEPPATKVVNFHLSLTVPGDMSRVAVESRVHAALNNHRFGWRTARLCSLAEGSKADG